MSEEDITEVYGLVYHGEIEQIETDVEPDYLYETWVLNGKYEAVIKLPLGMHEHMQEAMLACEKLQEEREHDRGVGETIRKD